MGERIGASRINSVWWISLLGVMLTKKQRCRMRRMPGKNGQSQRSNSLFTTDSVSFILCS